MITKFAQNW